jgi:heme exporter protein CcmD
MSFLADKYAVYVLSAYGATAAILGWLLWSTLAASARARRDLDAVERERGR